jgi:hypothetical protein
MIGLAGLLLLVASSSVDLVDETYRIPANEWRYVELSMRQRPALLTASIRAREGSGGVRVALLRSDDLERLRSDRAHGVLAVTGPGNPGRLQFYLRDPGGYAVVLDNRDGDVPATVHLRVWLDFGWQPGPAVTLLSPGRQFTVIAISFAVFFGIVSLSARRLLSGMKK